VLGDFLPEEELQIENTIPRVSESIACFLKEGMAIAMNRYN
jgi:hypothetical protein